MNIHIILVLLLAIHCSTSTANTKLGDFNGDGRADVLLREEAGTFTCSTNLYDGVDAEFVSVAGLDLNLEWHLAALIDLDGDIKDDLLLRHGDRGWFFAPMDGCSLKSDQQSVQFNDLTNDSRIVGLLDVNGDQMDDLVTRDDDGAWTFILLNNSTVIHTVRDPSGLPADTKFLVIGIGDFDGDRVEDILTRHVDGSWYLHTQVDESGSAFNTRLVPFQTRSDWRDEATADFDGDGQHDVLLRHATGKWERQTLSDGENASVATAQLSHIPSAWDWRTKTTGDIDGDERTELILFDDGSNQWYQAPIIESETSDNALMELFQDRGSVLPKPPVYVPDLALRRVFEIKLQLEPGEWINERHLGGVDAITAWDSRVRRLPHAISDLRGLRVLHKLDSLAFQSHQIESLTPLIGLNLNKLDLGRNQITDISALAGLIELTELRLYSNKVSDISSLGTLDNLRSLNLGFNTVAHLAPIRALTQLETLSLVVNDIVDIEPLAKLTNLKVLDLSANPISSVSALESLTQLESLSLSSRQLVDIAPLATLGRLKTLRVRFSAVSNLAPLAALTELTYLNMEYSEIVDITPLSTLVNLSRLDLSHNEIVDLSALESLIDLEYLDLSSNNIIDITPLANLSQLTSLDLASNAIADLSPLENLDQLETVDLANNEISDIEVLLSISALRQLDLTFNPLSEVAQSTVLLDLRERGIEVEYIPLLSFRDSRGRTATWIFDTDAASASNNGLLIHFHGNVTATSRDAVVGRFASTRRLAEEHGLVSVIIASPESWTSQEGWRPPNSDGDSTRFWNYREDVDLIHEMLQTDFGGELAINKDRVYFYGSSQGTCFLHPFLNRWGAHYRGGLLADCGCVDVNLDPIWHANPETMENFRVFVRAATSDFLHRASTRAYHYYKYVLGLETYGDLNAEGGHCAAGDVSRSEALDWLINGDGLDEESIVEAHFTRVSLADRVVGLATDNDGALWFMRQERFGDNPRASLWRSTDRGDSFEMVARHPFEVYDLDSSGDDLFVTTGNGPIRRSSDEGHTFEGLVINDSPAIGWIHDFRRSTMGRPYELKRPGLISTRSNRLLLLANVSGRDGSDATLLISDDRGRSWRAQQTPLGSIRNRALGPDPVVLNVQNSSLQLSDPVRWLATSEQLRWYAIDDPPQALESVAWDGNELIGYSWGANGRTWWSAEGPGGIWRERSWEDSVTEYVSAWRRERLTSLDRGDVLLFGSASEGHVYNGIEDSWTHIRGGTFLSRRGAHKVAVDNVRGDVFVSNGRGIFRLDARYREGLRNISLVDDADSDQIPDRLDYFPEDPTEYLDTDQDGVGNSRDSDDDGDGVFDGEDASPLDRDESADLDHDGIGDRFDNDVDGDGFSNELDQFPFDSTEVEDTDGDGIGDWEDQDDDNDGVLDVKDAFPRYALEQADQDGDFIGDLIDPHPSISTLDSELQFTAAHGPWFDEGSNSIQLTKDVIDGVIYPESRGDTRYYGRLSLGDRNSTGYTVMVSIFPGEYLQLVYFDRNGDNDLTNDGGPIRLDNGMSAANWYEIWVEVSYRSGITLPYHISGYRFRASIASIETDVMHLVFPPSGRATRITLPNGSTVSLAIVDANANAIFTDENDYVCVDVNNDRNFEGCGDEGAEHYPYGENIVIDGVSYTIEAVPSGYSVTVKTVDDAASIAGTRKQLSITHAHVSEPIRDERNLTPETFYRPPVQESDPIDNDATNFATSTRK